MKHSIRTKITGYFSILMLIILICQIVFNLFLIKPYFTYTKTKSVKDSFYYLTDSYSGSIDDVENIADELQNKYGIKVILLNDDEVIYTTGFSSNQKFHPPFKDEFDSPKFDVPDKFDNDHVIIPDIGEFSYEPEVKTIKDDNGKVGQQIMLTGKFDCDNGETVYVLITLPMESIDTSAALFTKVSIAISTVAFVIGIMLAIILSKTLIAPIKSIEQVAKSLSELDFTTFANEDVSVSELSSLAKSINTMSTKLKLSIEELQRANDKLKSDIDYQQKIEEMRRQFIANVSHEMKTPLGLLQIYCENLKNNVEGIDKEYYCDVIIEETANLNDMVMSMLDVSSIESGLSKMNFESVDFSRLCTDAVEKFEVILDDFDVVKNIDSNIIVNADEKHIIRAMNNYIQNAINHTDKNGSISISLKKNGDVVRFAVQNEGKCIADDDLEHLWEPFYKSDKARTRSSNNNVGLGLYIVKTIVEKHKGNCGVNNTENGVIFYFDLPV